MYENREESSKVGNSTIDSRFANIEKENVIGLKPGYDYSHLDDNGLIKENSQIDDKTVIIGKIMTNLSNPDTSLDSSTFPKKGQLGYVDKAIVTEGEEGFRLAKVRVRDNRIPAIGDKFCSRCGQKGTIGLIIPESDMPFTEDGIRPDIIVNPHAFPSRMTIGQLVETIMGKACCGYGAYGDCTAFINKGSKHDVFGKLLTKLGLHSSGNEILYNGQTGEQMESNIFIGPTYYMRLKHMVKDKINYRARGPRTALTRQTVQGRANDGGLRVGELERDAIVGHGLSCFLQESMMIRGDEFYMAVCNLTGLISIYNSNLNLFMSPMADGPIQFTGILPEDIKINNISKYGRDFSIIRIPYAFKLLMQELATMNINIRIITEDNIDQISSMSFSGSINNLEKLSIKKSKTNTVSPIEKEEEEGSVGVPPTEEEGEEEEGEEEEGEEEEWGVGVPPTEEEGDESPTIIETVGKRISDEFEKFQVDVLKQLTQPDVLEKVDQKLEEPLIKKPSGSPPVHDQDLQEKQPSEIDPAEDVVPSIPANQEGVQVDAPNVIVVGSDPTKVEEDIKEQAILPKMTDVQSIKDEEKEKSEVKKVIQIGG